MHIYTSSSCNIFIKVWTINLICIYNLCSPDISKKILIRLILMWFDLINVRIGEVNFRWPVRTVPVNGSVHVELTLMAYWISLPIRFVLSSRVSIIMQEFLNVGTFLKSNAGFWAKHAFQNRSSDGFGVFKVENFHQNFSKCGKYLRTYLWRPLV